MKPLHAATVGAIHTDMLCSISTISSSINEDALPSSRRVLVHTMGAAKSLNRAFQRLFVVGGCVMCMPDDDQSW
jgi:hypothetical protein